MKSILSMEIGKSNNRKNGISTYNWKSEDINNNQTIMKSKGTNNNVVSDMFFSRFNILNNYSF